MVAVRRLDLAAAKRLRRDFRGQVILAGAVITFLLTIPLVNLVTPIIATAFMLHVFENLRRHAPELSWRQPYRKGWGLNCGCAPAPQGPPGHDRTRTRLTDRHSYAY